MTTKLYLSAEKPKPKKRPQVKLRDASEFENDLPVLTSIHAGLDDEDSGDGQQVSKAVSPVFFTWSPANPFLVRGQFPPPVDFLITLSGEIVWP